jgi:CheY-like chemotaxis protein
VGAVTTFVLIVEDEADFIDELSQVFAELPSHTKLSVANSRETAFALLETEFFDLIVLDLKIPTIDGALDADPRHGHAVFARAQIIAPGTPILVLTGSPAEDFIPTMLQGKQQVDIWGEGRTVGTVIFLQKIRIDECPATLAPIAAAVQGLAEVELDRGGVNLTLADERLIRIFAKRAGGARWVP